MHKNKTEGSLLKVRKKDKLVDINEISNIKEENNNDNMNNNKKNIEDLKRINNHKNDKIKSLKKRYKKSLTESSKDIIDKNEKGNDSESYIIEGDSEYGDSEAFKL